MGCGASNANGVTSADPNVANPMKKKPTAIVPSNESENQLKYQKNASRYPGYLEQEALIVEDLDQGVAAHSKSITNEKDVHEKQKNKQQPQPSSSSLSPISDKKSNQEIQNQATGQQKRYKKGQMIDKGAYGKVYKGVDTQTNEIVAIKYIEVTGTFEHVKREVNSLKKEISLLKKLNHPNIVKYYDFDLSEDNTGVDIILEYVPNGSIRMALNRLKAFDEQKTAIYTKQVLEGLQYLHKNNIIHRDLKGANLLLDASGSAKLTDFGTAKQQLFPEINKQQNNSQNQIEDIAQLNKSLKGTPNWMAPEVIDRSGHTTSADIWSLGCVLIEMLTGRPPYHSLPAKEVFIRIASGVLPEFPKQLSEEARSFLESCFQIEPKKRSTAGQLLLSPFIQRKKLPIQTSSNRKMNSIDASGTNKNPLAEQEQLLSQIENLQQNSKGLSSNQQMHHPPERSLAKKTSLTILQSAAAAPLNNRPQQSAALSDINTANQANRMPPQTSQKKPKSYYEYQNEMLSNFKDIGQNLNNPNRANNNRANIHSGSRSPEKDIDNLAQGLRYMQENQPRSMVDFRSPTNSVPTKYLQQGVHAATIQPLPAINNNPQQQAGTKSGGVRTSAPQFNEINEEEMNFDARSDAVIPIPSSQKSITLPRKLPPSSSAAAAAANLRVIQQQRIPTTASTASANILYNNADADHREIEIEVPSSIEAKSIRKASGSIKQQQAQNSQQNPFIKHENTVINSKLNPDRAVTFSKRTTRTISDHEFVPNSQDKNHIFNAQNQIINTEIAQRDRFKIIQASEEFAKDKEQRKLAWEEELKRELEFQRQNPLPYLKY